MTLTQAIERALIELVITLVAFIMMNGLSGINNPFTLVMGGVLAICLCKFATLSLVEIAEYRIKKRAQ